MSAGAPVGFAELQDMLEGADAECGAAESHGVLCGVICAAGRAASDLWSEHLLGEGNTLSALAQSSMDLLGVLYKETLLHFNDSDLSLVLMLPDDNAALHRRIKALGQWCQGFLYGLALGGVSKDTCHTGHVAEIMHDLYEISHAGFDHEATDEAEEAAYMEIVEYVRMSVLLCHEELQPGLPHSRLQ